MRFISTAVALAAFSLVAQAQTSVGVTVDINKPGVYGRVTIGNVAPPVVYAEPVVIAQRPVAVVQPVYMKVPPGHAKKWGKHCHKYNACGEQVYFVKYDGYEDDEDRWEQSQKRSKKHKNKGRRGHDD